MAEAMTRRWTRRPIITYTDPVAIDGRPQPDFGGTQGDPECDHLLWDFSANRCKDCGLRASPGRV
jgi:hypothetical protein